MHLDLHLHQYKAHSQRRRYGILRLRNSTLKLLTKATKTKQCSKKTCLKIIVVLDISPISSIKTRYTSKQKYTNATTRISVNKIHKQHYNNKYKQRYIHLESFREGEVMNIPLQEHSSDYLLCHIIGKVKQTTVFVKFSQSCVKTQYV